MVMSWDSSPITPNVPSNFDREIVGDYVYKQMLAHRFSHYYNQRCWWMVPKVAGVINPSRPDHTKLSVRFHLWNCWGLCPEVDVGTPLFILLQPKMLTDGAKRGWCDQPHTPWPHQPFRPVLAMRNCRGLCWEINVSPPPFTLLHRTGDADRWCLRGPIIIHPQAVSEGLINIHQRVAYEGPVNIRRRVVSKGLIIIHPSASPPGCNSVNKGGPTSISQHNPQQFLTAGSGRKGGCGRGIKWPVWWAPQIPLCGGRVACSPCHTWPHSFYRGFDILNWNTSVDESFGNRVDERWAIRTPPQ